MYNHGFSTLALAEAYGQVQDERIGPALQKAVDLILSSQSQNPNGAWRYAPDSPDADTTVSGAQMVALFAARNAGIGVPDAAIQKALRFFAECQTPDGGHRLHRAGRAGRRAHGHRRAGLRAGEAAEIGGVPLGHRLSAAPTRPTKGLITNIISTTRRRLSSAPRPRRSRPGTSRM